MECTTYLGLNFAGGFLGDHLGVYSKFASLPKCEAICIGRLDEDKADW